MPATPAGSKGENPVRVAITDPSADHCLGSGPGAIAPAAIVHARGVHRGSAVNPRRSRSGRRSMADLSDVSTLTFGGNQRVVGHLALLEERYPFLQDFDGCPQNQGLFQRRIQTLPKRIRVNFAFLDHLPHSGDLV
jgi:hypothetical protein